MKTFLRSTSLALAFVAFAVPLWAGDGIWTPAGPPGTPSVTTEADDIILDPFSPSTLYTIHYGERGSGVWRTRDAGGNWTSINAGIFTSYVFSLEPDPFTPGTLYALANTQSREVLSKSTDGGSTWIEIYSVPAGAGVFFYGIAADPRTPGVLWAWGFDTVHRSDDGGVTWSPGVTLEFGFGIDFHPEDPDIAYFAGESHLWRTTDRGVTWEAVGSFNNKGFFDLQIAPARPSTIYARSWDFGLKACLRSEDGGVTWTPLPLPDANYTCVSLAVDDENPLRVWALAHAEDYRTFRLYGSQDGGATWSVRHDDLPEELSPYVLVREPASGAFYVLGRGGIYRSVDGGATWQPRIGGLTQTFIVDFLALPGPRTGLLASPAGTIFGTSNILKRSRNRGRFWVDTPVADVRSLALDPRVPGRILAGTFPTTPERAGLHESRDGGLTWRRLSQTPDTATSITFVPARRPRILIGTRNSGIFQSLDGGRTWVRSSAGLPFPEPCDTTVCDDVETLDVTVDARNPDIVHAVFNGVLVRSVNGGWKWTRVNASPEFTLFTSLVQDPRGALYAGSFDGIFKSENGGASWRRAGEVVGQIQDLAFDPREGGILYAATAAQGVLRSRDGGATFEPINLGLPIPNVTLLEIDPNVPGGLFAAVQAAGIWQGNF